MHANIQDEAAVASRTIVQSIRVKIVEGRDETRDVSGTLFPVEKGVRAGTPAATLRGANVVPRGGGLRD